MDEMEHFNNCRLCPRECGINRFSDHHKGFCRESDQLRIAFIGVHFGEEPPITGTKGSGTIFFSGCSLRCSFCQNHQISHSGIGKIFTLDNLVDQVEEVIDKYGVHNINFVTPDHFFPFAFNLCRILRKKGHSLPMLYNVSGYQSVKMLRLAESAVDIYLPDYKYSDQRLASALSRCRDYPEVALAAILEMVRQKGFLNSFQTGDPIADRGVLVRHLILPGYPDNSKNALTTLFLEFGPGLPISLMSQYSPVTPQEDTDLKRYLRKDEFDEVYEHAMDLGFHHLFVQFPETLEKSDDKGDPFVPDFGLAAPFLGKGN
ncbi:MAG: radical SAM protein [Thermodesulfobacteriota bacterium]